MRNEEEIGREKRRDQEETYIREIKHIYKCFLIPLSFTLLFFYYNFLFIVIFSLLGTLQKIYIQFLKNKLNH